MEWMTVSSSMIRQIAYDENDSSLYIEFRIGSVYRYANVPDDIYRQMLTAGSVGSYFNTMIKNKYETTRM